MEDNYDGNYGIAVLVVFNGCMIVNTSVSRYGRYIAHYYSDGIRDRFVPVNLELPYYYVTIMITQN